MIEVYDAVTGDTIVIKDGYEYRVVKFQKRKLSFKEAYYFYGRSKGLEDSEIDVKYKEYMEAWKQKKKVK